MKGANKMKQIALVCILLILSCGSDIKRSVQTYKVKKSTFHVNVVESGEVQAVNSINISTPPLDWRFGALKILHIIDDGTEISEGDTVIILDPSEVQKAIIDASSQLEIARAELNKLRAEQESKIQELVADLKIAQITHEISEIQLGLATFESDIRKKEIKFNLDQSKITLDKAEDEIENQKSIHREEQHQSKLKIKQLENNLEQAKETLQSLTVVSKSSGMAIIRKNWSSGNKWQVGDAPWSGMPLIDLPDLRALKAETEINEVDISKIELEQEVEIQLDAFSDTIYTGRVVDIAALAKFKDEEEESKVKIFPVRILIEGTSATMMPGMTVSCNIIVDKIDNVLFVPLEAITKEENTNYVFRKSGGSFTKQEVTAGIANNDYIVIEEGLEEGDQVALSNPYLEEEQEKKDES
jgi:multidrug efflux pump subunit AcrA (membrane-fusion protein)